MSDRGRIFGVEMELTGPDPASIIRALSNAGVPMSRRNLTTMREMPYGATNTDSNTWTLKHDTSVGGYALELVSPKLRGDAGFAALELVCTTLNSIGATVTRSCGLHVHHDFRGLDVTSLRRQVLALVERQDIMLQLVAPSRRPDSGNIYCRPWDAGHVQRLRDLQSLSMASVGPRGTVNLWAYPVHGSVEVRAHAGTTSFKKIAAWVRFGQAVFAAAEAGATLSNDTPQRLFDDLYAYGLTTADAAMLLRFETAGQTRAEVEARLNAAREAADAVLEEVQ